MGSGIVNRRVFAKTAARPTARNYIGLISFTPDLSAAHYFSQSFAPFPTSSTATTMSLNLLTRARPALRALAAPSSSSSRLMSTKRTLPAFSMEGKVGGRPLSKGGFIEPSHRSAWLLVQPVVWVMNSARPLFNRMWFSFLDGERVLIERIVVALPSPSLT